MAEPPVPVRENLARTAGSVSEDPLRERDSHRDSCDGRRDHCDRNSPKPIRPLSRRLSPSSGGCRGCCDGCRIPSKTAPRQPPL